MVLVLPPAPAARVLDGLALATLSALSAAAFLRIAVLGPPGGDEGRAVLEPAVWGEPTGELERGEDWIQTRLATAPHDSNHVAGQFECLNACLQ